MRGKICLIAVLVCLTATSSAVASDRNYVISKINGEYYSDNLEDVVNSMKEIDQTLTDDEYLKEVFRGLDKYSVYYTKEECEKIFVSDRQRMISASLLGDEIDIKIDHFGIGTDDIFKEYMDICQIREIKTLNLDLTDCPGGYISVMNAIAEQILPAGKILTAKFKNGEETYYSELEECPFEKIIVKISSHTASAAEILAADLQEAGVATIVGCNSYGKTSIQSMYFLESGAAFKITSGKYLTRSENDLTGIGVKPDIINYEYPLLIRWNKNCAFN